MYKIRRTYKIKIVIIIQVYNEWRIIIELHTCTRNLHKDQISNLFEVVNSLIRKCNPKIEQRDQGALANYVNPIK